MHFILAVTLAVWPLCASAVSINTLFDVDPSCTSYPVQQWADESLAMIQSANNAYYNAKGDANARVSRGYFSGLMNVKIAAPGAANTASMDVAEDVFTRTTAFLSSGVIPADNAKPYLTCSDKIFKAVSLDSVAKQREGTSNVVNTEGNPVTVRQEYADLITGFSKPVAYLVQLGASYQYVITQAPASVCNFKTLGETFLVNENVDTSKGGQPIIVLCPGNFANWLLTNTLGDRSPAPSNNQNPPITSKQALYNVLPKSQTLLHEVLHYAPFPARNLLDYAYFITGCQQQAGAISVLTPQCYVYLAVGAWYTENRPATVKGQQVAVTYASGAAYVLQ